MSSASWRTPWKVLIRISEHFCHGLFHTKVWSLVKLNLFLFCKFNEYLNLLVINALLKYVKPLDCYVKIFVCPPK